MNDPHHAEYLAAVEQLHEQTPSRKHPPAIGDFCSGVTSGRRWSGRVELIDGDWLTINVGGGWIGVRAADITH